MPVTASAAAATAETKPKRFFIVAILFLRGTEGFVQGSLVPPSLAVGKNTCTCCVKSLLFTVASDRYRTVIGLQACKLMITKCYQSGLVRPSFAKPLRMENQRVV
jgi:hypothetical protein